MRTAWAGALEAAGLTHLGLHFHVLRHVPGTRVQDTLGRLASRAPWAIRIQQPQIYINQHQQHLATYSNAVEQAQQAGYVQAREKKVTTDLESTLIS